MGIVGWLILVGVLWFLSGTMSISWIYSSDGGSDDHWFEQLIVIGTLLVLGPFGWPLVAFCVWGESDRRGRVAKERRAQAKHAREVQRRNTRERQQDYIRSRQWQTEDPAERALLNAAYERDRRKAERERRSAEQQLEQEILDQLRREQPGQRTAAASRTAQPAGKRSRTTWREERPPGWREEPTLDWQDERPLDWRD